MQKGTRHTTETKRLQSIGMYNAHARRKGEDPIVPDIESQQAYEREQKNLKRARRREEKKMITNALKKMGLL